MPFQVKVIVFIVASAGFVWLSWRSLRDLRSHGFYRFFAFESVLALILVNLDYWFQRPFSPLQIVSWLLFIVAVFIVGYGFQSLRKIGKPDSGRTDPTLRGVERTTELVTVGAYRYIRHPMYSSFLFVAWGVLFKHVSWSSVCLAAVTTFFAIMTAKMEEAENIRFFGADYQRYMKQTRMFVPYLF